MWQSVQSDSYYGVSTSTSASRTGWRRACSHLPAPLLSPPGAGLPRILGAAGAPGEGWRQKRTGGPKGRPQPWEHVRLRLSTPADSYKPDVSHSKAGWLPRSGTTVRNSTLLSHKTCRVFFRDCSALLPALHGSQDQRFSMGRTLREVCQALGPAVLSCSENCADHKCNNIKLFLHAAGTPYSPPPPKISFLIRTRRSAWACLGPAGGTKHAALLVTQLHTAPARPSRNNPAQLQYRFESFPFVHLFPVLQTNLSENLVPHYSSREPTKPSVSAPSRSFVFGCLFSAVFVLPQCSR